MTSRMTSNQFMQVLPAAVHQQQPKSLRKFRSSGRSWLCQLYYADSTLHDEAWNMGERRGGLKLGLHFESRDRAGNAALLAGFSRSMVEVKAQLGPQWEAEQ